MNLAVISRAVRMSTLLLGAAVSIGALGTLAGCDENKGSGTTPAPSTATSTTASTSASATTTAMASDSATTTASADPVPMASESAMPSASATTTASAAKSGTPTVATGTTASAAPTETAAAAAACGGKDQPKCPLQAWMASVMQPAMASKDATKLAAALRASAKLAPPGYGQWAQFSNDGATAVEGSKDVNDGKASCKNCHGAYQKKYRTEIRDRKI